MRSVRALVLVAMLGCQREKPRPIEHTAAIPVPAKTTTTTTGVPSCDEYLRRVTTCAKLPPLVRDELVRGAGTWKLAADQPGEAAAAVAESCASLVKVASPQLTELGC